MTTVTNKAITKVAAVATGLAMAASMLTLAPMAQAAALTDSQVQSILSLLSSFGADASTIANVKASLTGGTPTTTTTTTSTSTSCSFTSDLTMGSKGAEVTALQNGLIAKGFAIAAGATGYFGSQTQAAVIAWQKSAGVTPAAGYFGSKSRAAYCGSTTTTTTTTPVTGNGLKVSLSPTSPNGSVLVQSQAIGDLADFTFANPTAAPINVTGLTLNRTGVSNDSTLTNIYLYQGGTRLTDSVGISAGQFSFTDANGLFTVPAGSTVTVSVRSDIAGSTSGQQIGVSLVSVSSNGTLDSSVSFPIMSGYQTVSAATLASVNYTNATATPSSATTISAQNDYPLWQDNVSVSTNPVKLTSLRFTNLGSADSSAVTNLRLYVDGTMVGSALPTMGADRTATFDLSASPLTLTTSSHVVKVLGNITNSAASRTVQLSVQRSSDAMFVDSQLGQPVTPTANSTTFAAVSTGVITIQYASNAGVSVSLDPASPTANVSVGAPNVKWASFSMLASGENVKVQDLYVVASSTKSTGALDGVGGLNNGKIMVNGVQIGSTKDINQGNSSTARGSATDFSLGSSLILPAGQATNVDVYADAQDTAGTNLTNNSTVQVFLIAGSSNGQGQSSLTAVSVPASAVTANSITVSSATLTATKYTGYGNQTIVAGANTAKIGSFTLSAGSTEGVTVNTIAISMTSANAASITNLTLKDGSTILGSIITTPSGSAISAGQNNNSFPVNLSIPASSTKTIDIYANILSGANAGSIIAYVDTGTTGTGMTTGTSASVSSEATLQTITIGSGTLSAAKGAGDPVSNNVLAGVSSVNVGQFTFTATNSSYTVNNLAILVPNGAATSVTNVTVSYKDVNGATKTATQSLTTSASAPYATATFTGLGMYVPMNDSANLDVSVGTPTIASGATSGTGISVTLDRGATSGVFSATNSAGTATTQINSGTTLAAGGTFYVRKSIPTFAMLAAPSTVPSSGNALYRFSITADPAGAVEWTKLVFAIATTSATVTNVYLTDEASGANLLDNTTSSASTTATAITVDLTKNSTQATYQQVGAGATKTYDLYGTVAGYTTGSTITLSLSADSSAVANAAAGSVSGNTVWSDRSSTSHATSTSDWTNGYLLKNFTTNATTYSK